MQNNIEKELDKFLFTSCGKRIETEEDLSLLKQIYGENEDGSYIINKNALLKFIEKREFSLIESIERMVEEIHTELHNGNSEKAYKLLCKFLLELKAEKDKIQGI
jgi:hypothetical protein